MSTPVTAEVCGDINTPDEGHLFAVNAADSVLQMLGTIEQSRANLAGQENVAGPAIEYLAAMEAAAADLVRAWQARAARFAEHIAARNEHVSPDLDGTQKGRYLDPSGQHQ